MKDEMDYHGENKKNYFEGWYYRVVCEAISYAIIVGVSKNEQKQQAFIQIANIKSNRSHIVSYAFEQFSYDPIKQEVNVAGNIFKRDFIFLKDSQLIIQGYIEIKVSNGLKKSLYAPTIMGPFAYIPNMQCNHAILTMGSKAKMNVVIEEKRFIENCVCYQEKDWGTSFPTQYIWVQSNTSVEKQSAIFVSIATIPLKIIEFTGIIAVFQVGKKNYRFASYYGARIKKMYKQDDSYIIEIKQGPYYLLIEVRKRTTTPLLAPSKGSMERTIQEGLDANCRITLSTKKQELVQRNFTNVGLEIVDFFD